MQLIDDATHLAMMRACAAEQITVETSVVWALVDIDYQEAAPGDMPMDSALVRVTARTVDVAGVGTGSILGIRGESYRVLSNQPDGQGITVFLVEQA